MRNFWLGKKEESKPEVLTFFEVEDLFVSADKLFEGVPYKEHKDEDGEIRSAIVHILDAVNFAGRGIFGEVQVVDFRCGSRRSVWIEKTENTFYCKPSFASRKL